MLYSDAEECILETVAQLRTEDILEPCRKATEREKRIEELTGRMLALEQRSREIKKAIEDPENGIAIGALVNSLNTVEAERQEVAKVRDQLKLECTSGRAETLKEAQSLVEYREGNTGTERQELDRKIKMLLPTILEEIWVQAQRTSERHQIVHMQIFLRNGQRRYVQVLQGQLHNIEPWQLKDWDLRQGAYQLARNVKDTASGAVST